MLLVATAARLWHLDSYLHFANDEARDARVVMAMLEELDPVLVGPSASIGNFSLGPLFYYLEAPFFFVLDGDPLAGGLFAALVGIATVALLFRVGRRLFGRVGGSVAATLLATGFIAVLHSRWGWNPNLLPFFVLTFLYGIWLLMVRTTVRETGRVGTGLELAVFGLAAATQLHATAFALVVPFLVVLIWSKPRMYVSEVFISVLIGVGLYLPVWLKDAADGWKMLGGAYDWAVGLLFGEGTRGLGMRIVIRGEELLRLLSELLFARSSVWLGALLLCVVFGVLFAHLFQKARRMQRFLSRLLLVTLLAQMLPLLFLQERLYMHYVLQTLPVLLLVIALGVQRVWGLQAHPAVLSVGIAVPMMALSSFHVLEMWNYWSALDQGTWEGAYAVPLQDLEAVSEVITSKPNESRVLLDVSYQDERFEDALVYLLERRGLQPELVVDDGEEPQWIVERWSGVRGERYGRLGLVEHTNR